MLRLLALVLLIPTVAYAAFSSFAINGAAYVPPGACSNSTNSTNDGCAGAQTDGTIVDAHLADQQAVIALNITPGSGYTNGTFTWTSSGGGCSPNATGSITVSGGAIGQSNYTISNRGAGCTSRPTVSIPAGASGGSGGGIVATVYQVTPHNASAKTGINWSVAGVDYPIGYDTTLTLADPTAGGLPSGASFAGHTVTLAGSGGTLNGWNFGTHSTYLVVNANGWTITNNYFQCTHGTTTDLDQIHINAGVTSVTIKYNTLNGGSVLGLGCVDSGMTSNIQTVQTNGTLVIEYNYCYYPDSKCFNVGSLGSSTSLTITEKYNYWAELGTCGSGCAHGEAEYSYGSASQTLNWTLAYNVAINHYYNSPTNLTSEFAQVGDSMIVATTTQYNYGLAQGPWAVTGSDNSAHSPVVASASLFCGHGEGGAASGTITNNLWDYSGAYFPYNGASATCAGDFTVADFNAPTGNTCNTSSCN